VTCAVSSEAVRVVQTPIEARLRSDPTLLLTVLPGGRSRIFRFPFPSRIPFLASPYICGLANASGRIEFIIVLFMDWSFASGCSPPRLSTTQLPSATDRPVLLSGEDFHLTVGAYFQAHRCRSYGADRNSGPVTIKILLRAEHVFAPANVQTPRVASEKRRLAFGHLQDRDHAP
jgi:hypothetical protein